jgi:glycerophosphoryl diester phosphodiesterase
MTQESKTKIPLILAHRGASALAPENTMAAFDLAYTLGADGIELDVMLSKDNQLIVIHDDTVDRTTNGSGRVIDFTSTNLKELDAGSTYSVAFRGQKLPLLSEVFEKFGHKFLINVELKNYASPFDDLTKKVVELIEQHQLSDSVLLSSFNPINLFKAKRINPDIKRGLLIFSGALGKLMRGFFGRIVPYHAIHPFYTDVDEAFVQKAHKLGRKVNVWTVDDPHELIRLRNLGVDAVICNDPRAAREILENQ